MPPLPPIEFRTGPTSVSVSCCSTVSSLADYLPLMNTHHDRATLVPDEESLRVRSRFDQRLSRTRSSSEHNGSVVIFAPARPRRCWRTSSRARSAICPPRGQVLTGTRRSTCSSSPASPPPRRPPALLHFFLSHRRPLRISRRL